MGSIRASRLYRCLVIVSILACAASLAWAQVPGRKATVTTSKGETVEGMFVAANRSEVVLEVDGKRRTVPLDQIAVISFVGKVQPPASVAPVALVDDALTALGGLHAATEAGVRREQYSARLLETLPRVQAFLNSPGGSFADVRLLMAAAVRDYRVPFGTGTLSASTTLWTSSSTYWRDAANQIAYAQELASRPGEESHQEDPAESDISTSAKVSGRLGSGDRIMPSEVDRSTEGAFNDVYRLTVDRPMTISLALDARPCSAHLTLTDDAGKQIAGSGRAGGSIRITKDLKPGVYHVWAGAQRPDEVGTYELTVAARR
jgi:hypothetical protein